MSGVVGGFALAGPLVPCAKQVRSMGQALSSIAMSSNADALASKSQEFFDHRLALFSDAAITHGEPEDDLYIMLIGHLTADHLLAAKLKKDTSAFQNQAHLIHDIYLARGLFSLYSLKGPFLILIWDKNRQRFVCIRDVLGTHSIYYTQDGDTLWFSTHPQMLIDSILPSAYFSTTAMNRIFTTGFAHGEDHVIESIHQVLPGQMIVVEKGQCKKNNYNPWLYGDDGYHHPSTEVFEALGIEHLAQSQLAQNPHLLGTGLALEVLDSMVHEAGIQLHSDLVEETNAKPWHENFQQTILQLIAPVLSPMASELNHYFAQRPSSSMITTFGAQELFSDRHYFTDARWDVFSRNHLNWRQGILKHKISFGNIFYNDLDAPIGNGYWAGMALNKTLLNEEYAHFLYTTAKPWAVTLPEESAYWSQLEIAQYQVIQQQLLPWQDQLRALAKLHHVKLNMPFFNEPMVNWSNKIPSRYQMRGVQGNLIVKTSLNQGFKARSAHQFKPQGFMNLDQMTSSQRASQARGALKQNQWVLERLASLEEVPHIFNPARIRVIQTRLCDPSLNQLSILDYQSLFFMLSVAILQEKLNIHF